MSVGEILSLTVAAIMNPDRCVDTKVRLTADQTKGRHPRTVFLPKRLQNELQKYLDIRKHPPVQPWRLGANEMNR